MSDFEDRRRAQLVKAATVGLEVMAAAMDVVSVNTRRAANALQDLADALEEKLEEGEQEPTPPIAPARPSSAIDNGVLPGVPIS